MSRFAVIVAVLLVLILGGAAWLVVKSGPGPGPGKAPGTSVGLFTLDPREAVAIDIRWANGATASLTHSNLLDCWMMRFTPMAGGQPKAWPVALEQVNAALQVISELKGDTLDAGPPREGTAVTIRMRSGQLASLMLGTSAVGGRIDAGAAQGPQGSESSARAFTVDAQVGSAFERNAILTWLDPSALAPTGREPVTMQIASGGSAFTLKRTGREWSIVSPLAARADRTAAQQLAAAVRAIHTKRFSADEITPLKFGPTTSAAGATVVVTSDIRRADGTDVRRLVLEQELSVTGAADLGGSEVFVDLAGRVRDGSTIVESWGPMRAVVKRGHIQFGMDVNAYLARFAAGMPRADVKQVRLDAGEKARSWSRAGASWTAADSGAPVPGDAAAQLDALLKVLCESEANNVGARDPAGPARQARITLAGMTEAASMVLDLLEVTTPEGREGIEARAGTLAYLYFDPEHVSVLKHWLATAAAL